MREPRTLRISISDVLLLVTVSFLVSEMFLEIWDSFNLPEETFHEAGCEHFFLCQDINETLCSISVLLLLLALLILSLAQS